MKSNHVRKMMSSGERKANGKAGNGRADAPQLVFPLVLTSTTQQLFQCRVDEEVSVEKPHKLLKKVEILRDLKVRGGVSDFSPVKRLVQDYPGEDLLLVLDPDFTHGQNFYLVLTEEERERRMESLELQDADDGEDEDEEDEESIVPGTPESRRWISLGSEQEIHHESLSDPAARLRTRVSRVEQGSRGVVCLSDRDAGSGKGGCVELHSEPSRSVSITELERDVGVQATNSSRHASSQTPWKRPVNRWTQYEARELGEVETERLLRSEGLEVFVGAQLERLDAALQQNLITDVFRDEEPELEEDDGVSTRRAERPLKEHQSFMDPHYCRDKTISYIQWHPTISGLFAVAMTERQSLEEQIDNSTKLLLNPPYILFWSLSDPIHPQLQLMCPADVLCFRFCPSDPNIIAGGCTNGQVALWDISAHSDGLQGNRGDVTNTSNTQDSVDHTPVVHYCAVSGIESGHKSAVTDIQWLPETFEVSKFGVPVENSNYFSVQIITCAPDHCVLIWDLRIPRVTSQKPEEKLVENPHGVPDTFKHLNLTWKPFLRVGLSRIGSTGEYRPRCVSLSTDGKTLQYGERKDGLGFLHLRLPSAKQQKVLEDINTKLFVGTEDGELVYTDWRMEKDNDSGRLFSAKPSHASSLHDAPIHTVTRSPFFPDILLTVGSFRFSVWREGVTAGPLVSGCCRVKSTDAHWSPSRPAVFFMAKADGAVEVWDLLLKSNQPSQSQSVSGAAITCLRARAVSVKQHLLCVSDGLGTSHLLQIPSVLRKAAPSEMKNMRRFYQAEEERLTFLQERRIKREKEKKETEAREKKKKMMVPPQEPQAAAETPEQLYQQFSALEHSVLENMRKSKR